jgi:hypothetical protein
MFSPVIYLRMVSLYTRITNENFYELATKKPRTVVEQKGPEIVVQDSAEIWA